MRRCRVRLAIAALSLSLLASACTSSRRAAQGRRGFEQSGLASWYGPGFHGRTTANGETYDMEAMTAAHKQLPFGSIVEVRNRDNGRTTQVRINDRGPFVRGRIIDLSKAAARELGMLGPGVARVRIRVVGRASTPPSRARTSRSPARSAARSFALQAGAFRDRARAEVRLAAVLRHYPEARIVPAGGLHRIVVDGLSESAANDAVRALERAGIEAIAIPVD